MLILLQMLWVFFKIGLFTIGGGYAMIPLITREMVANSWMTTEEIADLIAIAQMTPGPFAVNTATFAGMKVFGIGGAIACTLGVILPSLIITLLVARFFFHFQEHKLVQGALAGIRPVVVALIAYAVWSVATMTLFSSVSFLTTPLNEIVKLILGIDWRAIVILAISLSMLLWLKLHPIIVITAAGALGILFFKLLPMVLV